MTDPSRAALADELTDWFNNLDFDRSNVETRQREFADLMGILRSPFPYSGAAGEAVLRHCGYCDSWHSKPCGEGCVWSPTDPTPDQFKRPTTLPRDAEREIIENETDNRSGLVGGNAASHKSPSRTAVAEDALPSEGMPPSDGGHHLPARDAERETIDEDRIADAIDDARYRHPIYPRERSRPFADADNSDKEYAYRLAGAAIRALPSIPSREGEQK